MKKPELKKTVQDMSDYQLAAHARRIINYFHDYACSDPFGWDWPTMYAVFPELCTDYKAVGEESKRRLEAQNSEIAVFNKIKYRRVDDHWKPVEE